VLDHVDIRVAGRDASERFYDTVLRALDKERLDEGPEHIDWGELTIGADLNEHPPSINKTNCNRPANPSLHLPSSMSGPLPRSCQSSLTNSLRTGPDNPFRRSQRT